MDGLGERLTAGSIPSFSEAERGARLVPATGDVIGLTR